jgi:hypothetical protein
MNDLESMTATYGTEKKKLNAAVTRIMNELSGGLQRRKAIKILASQDLMHICPECGRSTKGSTHLCEALAQKLSDDHDWVSLVRSGDIAKEKCPALKLFLKRHSPYMYFVHLIDSSSMRVVLPFPCRTRCHWVQSQTDRPRL